MSTEKSLERIADVAADLAEFAQQQAGPAWETALAAVQVDAMSALVRGGVSAVIAFCCAVVGAWAFLRVRAAWLRNDDDAPPHLWLLLGLSIPFVASALIALTELASVWNYTALRHPELYLAKQALGL